MPLDAVFLSRLLEETRPMVVGARIDKIHQTAKLEIVLSLRGNGGAVRLLLSARPGAGRMHITEQKRENPAEPPMFCMLLRKHLSGGRITELVQLPGERIVRMEIESVGELGDQRRRTLMLEAMGQQANLVLLDDEGRVLDALRRVEGDLVTGKRQVLPGLFYALPHPLGKPFAGALTGEQAAVLLKEQPAEQRLSQALSQCMGGLSPALCRELTHRVGDGDLDISLLSVDWLRFAADFDRLMAENQPTLLLMNGEAKDFSFLELEQYGAVGTHRRFDSYGALLDHYFGSREQTEQMRQRGETLRKLAERTEARLARKLALQQQELERANDRETMRMYGDLITSNLHRMEKGQSSLTCDNYYDPENAPVTIRLDPLKTPQQNAARYYKDYTRMKTAEEMLARQMAQGEQELEYIRSVLDAILRAEQEGDLRAIRSELQQNGYLKEQKGKKQQKMPAQKPLEYVTTAGRRVQVGRNNLQNEQLTFSTARHTDIWLHVQKAPGSHVILECDGGMPDDASLEEAAALAVRHSSRSGGGKVAVDYTPVRNLKKTPGGKTGMVIYHKYWTLYAFAPVKAED